MVLAEPPPALGPEVGLFPELTGRGDLRWLAGDIEQACWQFPLMGSDGGIAG